MYLVTLKNDIETLDKVFKRVGGRIFDVLKTRSFVKQSIKRAQHILQMLQVPFQWILGRIAIAECRIFHTNRFKSSNMIQNGRWSI